MVIFPRSNAGQLSSGLVPKGVGSRNGSPSAMHGIGDDETRRSAVWRQGLSRRDGRESPCQGGLLDEPNLAVDLLDHRTLALVEAHLVLFKQVVALGVDRDDQRAELPHAIYPQGFWHAEILPFGTLDLFHLGCC